MRIQYVLMQQIEERGLGVVFDAPVDVILSDLRIVQPDLVVIRTERQGIVTDRTVKAEHYASEGVAEYWIVDPSAHTIEVYARDPGAIGCATATVLGAVSRRACSSSISRSTRSSVDDIALGVGRPSRDASKPFVPAINPATGRRYELRCMLPSQTCSTPLRSRPIRRGRSSARSTSASSISASSRTNALSCYTGR